MPRSTSTPISRVGSLLIISLNTRAMTTRNSRVFTQNCGPCPRGGGSRDSAPPLDSGCKTRRKICGAGTRRYVLFDIVSCAVTHARPHPEERACRRRSAKSNARARVSKDEERAVGSPLCFETRRGARRLWKHLRSRRTAMLLSMRARVHGDILAKQPNAAGT
jgi:hypothetical protein